MSLCELIRAGKPNIIFLFETLVVASKLENIRIKLNLQSCVFIDYIGRSGRISVL